MKFKLLETSKVVIQIETAVLINVNSKSSNHCNIKPRFSKTNIIVSQIKFQDTLFEQFSVVCKYLNKYMWSETSLTARSPILLSHQCTYIHPTLYFIRNFGSIWHAIARIRHQNVLNFGFLMPNVSSTNS